MSAKILIRNIPAAIWQGLELLAAKHQRGVEAEARYAIDAWVSPQIQKDERSARVLEVSARLRDALGQVNSVRQTSLLIKPSHIAEAIGDEKCEDAENWFAGQAEPTLKQIESIASFLGCSASHLKHGDFGLFPTNYCRISRVLEDGMAWLLDTDGHEKLVGLYFIRATDSEGSFVVIKQYDEHKCTTYRTPFHISEDVGANGESDLAHLVVLLEFLYLQYTSSANTSMKGITIKSYVLPREELEPVTSGRTHPLKLVQSIQTDQPWWEDIWSQDEVKRTNYWVGWKALCARINRVIDLSPKLQQERDAIRQALP